MSPIFTNRIAMVQLAAMVMTALAACNIVLPPGFDEAGLSAAILLTSSAVSAVLRFGHPGEAEAEAKAWWQSRTIWTQLVGAGCAAGALVGIVPATDQANLVEVAMALVGIVTMLLGPTVNRIESPGASIAGVALALAGSIGLLLMIGGCGTIGAYRSNDVAAGLIEDSIGIHLVRVQRRLDLGTIGHGAGAARALDELEAKYAAVRLARAALDRSDHAPAPVLAAMREATDRTVLELRSRLHALSQN